MGRLQDLLLRHELKPRVVHRLPGRLRLHLPALKRLASFNGDVTPTIEEYLILPEGIKSVSVNTRVGSMLICYQGEKLTESKVLEHVQSLSNRVQQMWSQLKHLDPAEDREQILNCLQNGNGKD